MSASPRRWWGRVASFGVGTAILFHEVYLTPTSEIPLLVIAMYFMGVPVADIIDHLQGRPRSSDTEDDT